MWICLQVLLQFLGNFFVLYCNTIIYLLCFVFLFLYRSKTSTRRVEVVVPSPSGTTVPPASSTPRRGLNTSSIQTPNNSYVNESLNSSRTPGRVEELDAAAGQGFDSTFTELVKHIEVPVVFEAGGLSGDNVVELGSNYTVNAQVHQPVLPEGYVHLKASANGNVAINEEYSIRNNIRLVIIVNKSKHIYDRSIKKSAI